jgi:hypothetical protein
MRELAIRGHEVVGIDGSAPLTTIVGSIERFKRAFHPRRYDPRGACPLVIRRAADCELAAARGSIPGKPRGEPVSRMEEQLVRARPEISQSIPRPRGVI